jgi:hypothetical protein
VEVGIAKLRPTEPPDFDAMKLAMPTTSPFSLKSGPPELPWLMGTSVCNSLLGCNPLRVSVRSALTTPEVTVWVSPSGAPIANSRMPGLRTSESPSEATTGFFGGLSALRSARSSVRESVTICAVDDSPSTNSTSIRSASSTTCAAVTTQPSA